MGKSPFHVGVNSRGIIHAGIYSNLHHIEEAQKLCDSLKERGIIKSFIGVEGVRSEPVEVANIHKGGFDLRLNEKTYSELTEFMTSKGIKFSVYNETPFNSEYDTQCKVNLETEMTMEEQLKLMTEISEATSCRVPCIIHAIAFILNEDISISDEGAVDMYAISPATAPKSIYGDVDQNGDVTLADAVSIVSYIANPAVYPLTEAQLNRADVENTGDGINTADALAVQSYLLESVESLPVSYAE